MFDLVDHLDAPVALGDHQEDGRDVVPSAEVVDRHRQWSDKRGLPWHLQINKNPKVSLIIVCVCDATCYVVHTHKGE